MERTGGPTVLIINDSPDQLDLMRVVLQSADNRIITADGGEAGLEVALREAPDLIISDVSMPRLDGIELCRRVRADARLRTTPLLLVSAIRKDAESAVAGLRAGADDYLEAPFEPPLLIAKAALLVERGRHEEALRASEERFRLLVQGVRDYAIFWLDAVGRVTSWNEGAERIKGYRAHEVLGKHYSIFFPPREVEQGAPEKLLREAAERGGYTGEGWRVRKDGSLFFAWVSLTAIRDERGGLSGFAKVSRDMTERKRAEDALRESENRLRLITSQMPAFLWATDSELRVTYSAGAGHALTGTSPDQFIGVSVYEINQTEDESDQSVAAHLRALRGEPVRYEADWLGRTLETHIEPLRGVDGSIIGTIGVCVDVTERKRLVEELSQRSEQLAESQRMARLGGWELDVVSQKLRWSDELYRVFGVSPQQFTPSFENVLNRVVPEDREKFAETVWGAFKSGEPFRLDFRIRRGDGQVRWLHSEGLTISGKEGQPLKMRGATQDVTRMKFSEERLRESEGELRALLERLQWAREEESLRISRELHDGVGSLLTALRWDLEALEGKLVAKGPALGEGLIEKARSIVELVGETIKSVRQISRRLRPVLLDDLGLAAAVRHHVGEFCERIRIQCNLQIRVDDSALPKDYSTVIFRILQESLTNVARHSEAKRVSILIEERGGRIILEVEDDGRGFSEGDICGRVSVGVVGMRERARQLGGELKITSTLGKGTKVVVDLPQHSGK